MSLAPDSRLFPRLCWVLVPARRGLWDRAVQGCPMGPQICQHGLIQSFCVGSQPPGLGAVLACGHPCVNPVRSPH